MQRYTYYMYHDKCVSNTQFFRGRFPSCGVFFLKKTRKGHVATLCFSKKTRRKTEDLPRKNCVLDTIDYLLLSSRLTELQRVAHCMRTVILSF